MRKRQRILAAEWELRAFTIPIAAIAIAMQKMCAEILRSAKATALAAAPPVIAAPNTAIEIAANVSDRLAELVQGYCTEN